MGVRLSRWHADAVVHRAEASSLARHANIADEDARDHFLAAWIPEEGFHDGHEVHAPVGSYAANAFGLHDLHGNVWEWCRDAFALYLFPVRAGDGLRQAPIDSRERVGRGGGFFGPASKARAAARMDLAPSFRNRGLGLRPAMNLP